MAWQRRANKYRKKPAQTEEEEKPAVIRPGKITSIESQKKNPRRISIYVNDKFAFGLHQDVLLQHNLYSGLDVDEETILALIAADALLRAKEAAITYLGHRARSEHEVRTKLKGKGFEASIVEQVVKRLHELSYLDDERFAQSFTRNRFKHKGYGPQRIRAELRRLGIAQALIEETLETQLNQENVSDSALEQARKRLKRLHRETDLTKKRRKLFDFLMRRGHTSEVAREVISKLEL